MILQVKKPDVEILGWYVVVRPVIFYLTFYLTRQVTQHYIKRET